MIKDTRDLIETARRAEGSVLLPKISFGTMNAEELILRLVEHIEFLEDECDLSEALLQERLLSDEETDNE